MHKRYFMTVSNVAFFAHGQAIALSNMFVLEMPSGKGPKRRPRPFRKHEVTFVLEHFGSNKNFGP